MTSSAVFVGAARDCARYLPRALACWERLAGNFDSASFLVAENDSTDASKTILAEWAAAGANRRVLWLDETGPASRDRTEALAAARNALLDTVRSDPALRSAQWLIVMDMDDASLAITPRRLARCMSFRGWDALFANQIPVYYDIWALRSARSPDDFGPRLDAVPAGWRRRLARLVHTNWRARPIAPWREPLRVSSAFGGFGIYRMPVALGGRYCGWRDGRPVCEHVPFHEELCQKGARLFVHPGLVNAMPAPVALFYRRWIDGEG